MKTTLRHIALASLLLGATCVIPPLAAADSAKAGKRDSSSAKSSAQAAAEEIGSTRNAKVAIAMTDKKTELTFFAGAMSDAEKA